MKHLLWTTILTLCLSAGALAQQDGQAEANLVLQSLRRGSGLGGSTSYRVRAQAESTKAFTPSLRGGLYLPVENFGGKRVPFAFRAGHQNSPVQCFWGPAFVKRSGQPESRELTRNTQRSWSVQTVAESSLDELVELKAESPISGRYDIQLNGIGEVSFQLTPKHRFLLPALLAEGYTNSYRPSENFKISWQRVRGAKGYYVTASGRNAQGESISWSSSKDARFWQNLGSYQAMREGTLLGASQTNVTMPKGLFSGKITVQIHAVGPLIKGFAAKNMSGFAWPESITELEVLPK